MQLSSSITATDVTIKTSKFDEYKEAVEISTVLDDKENIVNQSRNSDNMKQIPSSSLLSSSVSSSVMGKRSRENNDLMSTINPQIGLESNSTSTEDIEGVKSLSVIKNNNEFEISRPVKGTLGVKQIWVHVKHRFLVKYKCTIEIYHVVTSSEFKFFIIMNIYC